MTYREQNRPLVISFAQQPLIRQMVSHFPLLDVRFVDDIAASQRLGIYDQAVCMIAAGNPVNSHTLTPWHHLQFVQTLGSGYNNLDMAELRRRGIVAAHNPGHNAQAVAEHVLMSAMYLLRNMGAAHQMVTQARFSDRQRLAGQIQDLNGLTLGIYGFGYIGKALARLSLPFDVHILYHQRHPVPDWERQYGVQYVSADEIWRSSDIVVLTVPLTEATYHLASNSQFDMMKSTAIVINVGRGPVVDEKALAQALIDQKIAGAALDVFESEPIDPNSPLLHLPEPIRHRVLFSPHVSGVTRQALQKMIKGALDNVQRFVNHEPLLHQLLPEEHINPWDWRDGVLQKLSASHPSGESVDIH
ncbi:MAG: hypothetical protein C7B47_01635 [Sulfobacillus thermosulfidooxidans]|uniref:Lactate dehydrogenase n=1 Tax=Sulfobacillus thermosulfidooxidans TaxID=28034 RepID=A0A2T2X4M9_SULTH|nr:MAG: hypothetical protein C7B47_01635 [Sulfobacillus thermosulfidooxidans]